MAKKNAPKQQFDYKLPKLCRPQDDDLAKHWSVDYSIWLEAGRADGGYY